MKREKIILTFLPSFLRPATQAAFPGSFGKLLSPLSSVGHNKPLSTRKKAERLEKTRKVRDCGDAEDTEVKCTETSETIQTQMPKMGLIRYGLKLRKGKR